MVLPSTSQDKTIATRLWYLKESLRRCNHSRKLPVPVLFYVSVCAVSEGQKWHVDENWIFGGDDVITLVGFYAFLRRVNDRWNQPYFFADISAKIPFDSFESSNLTRLTKINDPLDLILSQETPYYILCSWSSKVSSYPLHWKSLSWIMLHRYCSMEVFFTDRHRRLDKILEAEQCESC
jgi:hypothetical protein